MGSPNNRTSNSKLWEHEGRVEIPSMISDSILERNGLGQEPEFPSSESLKCCSGIIKHPKFTKEKLKDSQLNPNLSIEKSAGLGVIIQARIGSSRLPGKVAKIVGEKEYLLHQIERVLIKIPASRIVVATTTLEEDDLVCQLAVKAGVVFFRGSSQDVLKRYIDAAEENKFTDVVRLTGDSPLLDPYVMDEIINVYNSYSNKSKYVSNTLFPSFPLGFNVEITSLENLRTAWYLSESEYDREHVTPYIKSGALRECSRISCSFEDDLSDLSFTLDTVDDHFRISKILPAVSGYDLNSIIDTVVKNKADWAV